MNCLAVDDEPLALNVIREFCSKIDFLDLKAVCHNALDAATILREQEIDLLFLDIQMPHITGLEFMKTMQHPPITIFTTAYSEHALQGFEVNAIDYLVKPIPFDRFYKAVQKAYDYYLLQKQSKEVSIKKDEPGYIMIKADYSTVRINLKDILFIEGVKDYVKIATPEKSYLTKSTMKNVVEKLPAESFIRVHKSYVVSFEQVKKIENNRIVIHDQYIPIGDQYKELFQEFINRYKL